MIYSFKFKNFCSFSDESVIDFELFKSKELKSDIVFDTPKGTRLNKVTAVIGANASGKTTALKALTFLMWFVVDSALQTNKDAQIIFDNFFNNKDNSEFEIIFECNKEIYKYILHLNKDYVVKEELYKKNEITSHFNYLFKYKRIALKQKVKVDNILGLKEEILSQVLKNNTSLISSLGNLTKNVFFGNLLFFLKNATSNVSVDGKLSFGENNILGAAEEYAKKQKLFEKAKSFLVNIDLGLSDILIEKRKIQDIKTGETVEKYLPFGMHKVDDQTYPLFFSKESNGTKNMFILLHWILPVLETGGIAIIDELAADMHPHAIPAILELFISPETNPKNAQLLFTSHSLEILNYLEKEQVVLVEKGDDCKSELYRLDDIQGVRRDENIYAKYMAGSYGAVPRI